MKSTPSSNDTTLGLPTTRKGVMFSKWGKKSHIGKSSSVAKPEKDYHPSSDPRKRIRKRPSKKMTMIMASPQKPKHKDPHSSSLVPGLPSEDVLSFDTRHSTPRAKTKLQRGYVNVFDRLEHRVKDSSTVKDSVVLPFSIDFISLLLPGGDDINLDEKHSVGDIDEVQSCVGSSKDTRELEEATIMSGSFSFMSGRTVIVLNSSP